MNKILSLQKLIVDDLFNSEDNDLSTVSISCKKESTVSIFICVRPPKE